MSREIRRKEAKKNKQIKKVEEIDTSIKGSTLVKLIVGTLLILLVLYYVVAIFVTKEIEISWINDNNTENNTNSVENRILAKNAFNQSEESYYVYFYDFNDSDETIEGVIGLADSTVYRVDTSSALNKNYVTEENSNRNATTLDELKVKSNTVIKITTDKIVGYYEGSSEIIDFFK